MKCFHHTDMDGWCAAAIVAIKENSKNMSDFIEIDYEKKSWKDRENIIQELNKDEDIYIVDLSFDNNTVKYLKEICNKVGFDHVHWCDHHKTSIETMKKFPEIINHIKGILSDENSGAYLTWQYLMKSEQIPFVIKLVSDFDTFHLKLYPSSMQFKYCIESENKYYITDNCHPNNIYAWKMLIDSDQKVYECIEKGKIMMKYAFSDFERYRDKYCYESKIGDIPCVVINRQGTGSMIFGDLQSKYDYLITYVFNGDKYIYSIYSENKDPKIDCSLIAKQYGGGGHKGAAGFTSDKLLFKKVKEVEFNE